MVAVGILFVLFAGPFAILQQSLRAGGYVKDQTVAYYLAQDAEEYIKNLRDSAITTNASYFQQFLTACGAKCTLDTSRASPANISQVVSSCSGSCPPLLFDPTNNIFGYTSGSESPYTRSIEVSNPTASEFQIDVDVSWATGFLPRTVGVSYSVFDFTQAVSPPESSGGTTGSPPPPPPSSGLIAHWPFDTDADDVVGSANGTLVGGASITVASKIGSGALTLDGVNDSVDLGAPASLSLPSEFTIAAWVRWTGSTGSLQSIYSAGGTNGAYFVLDINTGLKGLYFFNDGPGSGFNGDGNVIPISTWRHAAMTRESSGAVTFYVDGEEAGQGTYNSLATSGNKAIGRRAEGAAVDVFKGQIDDVRIYDRALSQSEIQDLFNGTGDTTAPDSITDLAVTGSTQSTLDMEWSAPDDSGITCSGCSYDLRRSTAPIDFDNFQFATQITGLPSADVSPGTTRTKTVTGLAPATTYYLAIKTRDAAGNFSGLSNLPSAATDAGSDSTPPSTPGSLSATAASASQINLSWSASADAESGIANYEVYRCSSGASCTPATLVGTPGATSFSNTGLSASTLYRYRVRAVNGAGLDSSYSNIAEDTTSAGGAGGTLTIDAIEDSYVYDDNPSSTNNGPNISVQRDNYITYLKFDLSSVPGTITDATLYLYEDHQSGTGDTDIQALQVSNDGWSENSITWNNAPSTGSVVDSTPVDDSDNTWFSWDVTSYAESEHSGDGTLSIAMRTDPSSNFNWRRFRASEYGSQIPYLDITYSGGGGDTQPPTLGSAIVPTVISTSQIDLDWGNASDNVAVTGYELDRCTGSGCSSGWTTVSRTTSDASATGLSAGTTYGFRVRAKDAVLNWSGYSSPTVYATTQSACSGLISRWTFDSTWTDAGCGGHTLSATGGATFNTSNEAVGSGALSLDGSGDSASPSSAMSEISKAASGWSVSSWVRVDAVPSSNGDTVWQNVVSASDSVGLQVKASGKIVVGLWNGSSYVTYKEYSGVQATTWYHVVTTYDGSALHLWVNGTESTASSETPALGSNTGFKIGDRLGSSGWELDGLIDDVRVYDYQLSGEIQTLCDGGNSGCPTGGGSGSVDLYPTEDTWVFATNPTTNYGSNTTIDVQNDTQRITYIKFDIGSVPNTIQSATLKLKTQNTSGSSTDNVFLVTNDSWTEGGINWNNDPGYSTALGSASVAGASGNYYSIPLSAALLDAQRTGDGTLSIAITQPSTFVWHHYYSSEGGAGNQPYLEIDYGP